MDKDVKLGSNGDVDFAFSEGKASITGKFGLVDAGLVASLSVSCDVKVPLEALKKAVDGKLPAEAPMIDVVFGWLESALAAAK